MEMFVTWSTVDDTNGSLVEYGKTVAELMQAEGTSTRFVEHGQQKNVQYIHRVKLTNLVPGQTYG